MEGCCLDRFIKQGNVSSFYGNDGGDLHQSNDTIREFHLHLSNSNLQNAATTTDHLYTLLANVFEKEQMIRGRQCGIKQMDAQVSIGVPLPTI